MGVLDLDAVNRDARTSCVFAKRALTVMDSDDIDRVTNALREGMSARKVWVALRNAGVIMSENGVQDHLRGRCSCDQDVTLFGVI